MFTLNKDNKICFKGVIVTDAINARADYDKLILESSIHKANRFLDQSKHIYKTSKLLDSKITIENNIYTLKIKTYNKKYDADYSRAVCFVIDRYNLILISH